MNCEQNPIYTPTNIMDTYPHLRQTLELVADKWVVAVLYILSHGTRRYGELQREIGDISQRMLTRTLRDLERNGLVERKVYPVVPPMVEYSLTPLGKTINGVLKSLCDWSKQNFDAVETARTEYDRAQRAES
ncbi:winged helix-turn-helix transcriptional regulator [Altericista sp. CCNU0014]|uniref:winged helix-turn-helix transcriptional regulator n=1 Tax=Altericista sp. CCNU0014 TaxID=3082949 RepID=UPI00384A7F43